MNGMKNLKIIICIFTIIFIASGILFYLNRNVKVKSDSSNESNSILSKPNDKFGSIISQSLNVKEDSINILSVKEIDEDSLAMFTYKNGGIFYEGLCQISSNNSSYTNKVVYKVDLCQYIRHKKLNFLCNFSS